MDLKDLVHGTWSSLDKINPGSHVDNIPSASDLILYDLKMCLQNPDFYYKRLQQSQPSDHLRIPEDCSTYLVQKYGMLPTQNISQFVYQPTTEHVENSQLRESIDATKLGFFGKNHALVIFLVITCLLIFYYFYQKKNV